MNSYIHMIRHGITAGNEQRCYYGASDIPLSAGGREGISDLVKQGIYPHPREAGYYTSGMKRTEETFGLIYGREKHGMIENLSEMRFGIFEMKCYDELKETEAYQKWINDSSGTLRIPGGESISEFRERIENGFVELLASHMQNMRRAAGEGPAEMHSIIVFHGGPIATLMENRFRGGREHFYQWIPDPGRGFTLNFEDDRLTGYSSI